MDDIFRGGRSMCSQALTDGHQGYTGQCEQITKHRSCITLAYGSATEKQQWHIYSRWDFSCAWPLTSSTSARRARAVFSTRQQGAEARAARAGPALNLIGRGERAGSAHAATTYLSTSAWSPAAARRLLRHVSRRKSVINFKTWWDKFTIMHVYTDTE